MQRRARLFAFALVLVLGAGCRSVLADRASTCRPCASYFQGDTSACPVEAAADRRAPRFQNLVLEGGGVKGAAYPGALAVLDAWGQLASIERVAGTSAGAITALMVALGYTPTEIHDVVLQVDLGSFRDGSFPGDLERLIEDYGWYKGNDAQCVLECLVERKTGSKSTTFAELRRMRRAGRTGLRDLFILATDLNNRRSVEFSYRNHAEVPLATAARMSMSIPFFFVAHDLDGDVLVDGGVLRNYPIAVFDGDTPNPETIGLHLGTNSSRARIDDLLQFTEDVFMTLLDSQVTRLCRTPADVRRSVFIDPLGIATTDFGLSEQQKCALMASGAKATREYLERVTPEERCPGSLLRPHAPPPR